uniref:AIG1-type G domain-containing protein n=1 Tax=Amphilophus citrinellus TaxID=61819 RepID=A0A3Q0SFX3_AMPCI
AEKPRPPSPHVHISSRPPAVYQLRAKKQKFGTLTGMTVGEKNVNKINKTILLVGETGTGRSTLINALFNYSMGVKFEGEVCQTESQTSDVIVYEIFGYEGETLPCSLTIIDTPGYGDTRGILCDDSINHKLLELFQSEIESHEIHAVGLVMKATDNRLSDQPMSSFNSVMSLFGKDLEKNIVALITHSNGRRPKNALEALKAAKVKCAKNDKNEPVYFLFDNCQHEDRTEEEKFLKDADEISERGMREFTAFLGKTAPQKLEQTVEVLNERIRLTDCIQNIQDKLKLTELKQTEIKHIQEEFTVEVDEVYKEKKPTDGGRWTLFFYQAAVCCTVCEENCHYPRRKAWKPEQCVVMNGGRCTVCTGKCPASAHVREKWRYVTKTKKAKETMEELKLKYEKNKTESEEKLSLLENLKTEMKQLTAEKKQFLDESYQHVVRLEQIALKADSVSTYVHLDFLMKMKEEGDTEKVQKLKEMRSRVDEGSRAVCYNHRVLLFIGQFM